MKTLLYRTRSSDWRFSFIPQIFGLLYLWIYLLNIRFSLATILLLALSFFTSIGFAALGYFINEFFDKNDDLIAGKKNKLASLSASHLILILLGILCVALLPWVILPNNHITLVLVLVQFGLFIVYAAPPFRMKNHRFFAGIIDAAYAYLVPLVLSFYTFYLYSNQADSNIYIVIAISVLFFIAGYRNILIHYLDDYYTDKKLGKKTLPCIIGISQTLKLIIVLVRVEYFIMLSILIISLVNNPIGLLFRTIVFLGIALQLITSYYKKAKSIRVFIKLPNTFYQFYFPIIALVNLVTIDVMWLIWLPIHIVLLIPFFKLKPIHSWWQRINFQLMYIAIRQLLSWGVNYSIFFFFFLFGVNLKKKKMSATEYLKTKIKPNTN